MPSVALVTGSSRGIGLAIARALAMSGYIVYVNGRDERKVAQAARDIGDAARPLAGDLSGVPAAEAAVRRILDEQGALDCVVANIGSGRSPAGWEVPEAELRRIFEINFFSAAAIAQAASASMIARKRKGHLVAIASIAGLEALGAPIAYSAAKSALIAYFKNLARSLGPLGIRANVVSPGNVMFPGSTWDDKIRKDEAEVRDYISRAVPLNGFAAPEDVARAVLFLEQSPFMTGANIVVDGGQTRAVP